MRSLFFFFLNKKVNNKQIACGITHTNNEVHKIISENIHLSACTLVTLKGWPRYCPSIEDKIVNLKRKNTSNFLEPEGLKDNTIYPNGISTSLPEEIQLKYC